MGWLSDTWREITSLGKAKTETYNGSSSSSSSSRPSSSSSRTYSVPTRPDWGAAPGRSSSRPSSSSSSSGSTTPYRSSWGASPGRTSSSGTSTRTGRGGSFGDPTAAIMRAVQAANDRVTAANARTAAASESASDGKVIDPNLSGTGSAATSQQLMGRQLMKDLGVTDEDLTTDELVAGPDAVVDLKSASPSANKAAADRERQLQAWNDYRAEQQAKARGDGWGLTPNTHELSDDEFAALSPRQQSAVLFNTGLVEASSADRRSGGDSATRDYLTTLDLLDGGTDVDAFLSLDQAISDSLLAKLDDPDLRQDSASSLRAARGVRSAAPQAFRVSDALAASGAMSSLAQRRLGGTGSVQANPGDMPLGYGSQPEDTVVQMMYGSMVDPQYDMNARDVVEGLAQVNQANGTNVSPQQLWDFVGSQLDAADFGRIRGNGDEATVAVADTSITPLSVKEIRARYGL